MYTITSLALRRFRCFSELDLTLGPGVNLLYGDNGSGKTSVLEGLYYLGCGRSFVSQHRAHIIQHQQPDFLLVLTQQGPLGEVVTGIQRARNGDQTVRRAGVPLSSLAELASGLPVMALHQGSYGLLKQGPQQRRAWLDWGMFHVKHEFYPLWRQFSRLLKQRNAALRQARQAQEVKTWDAEWLRLATEITALREIFVEELAALFELDAPKLLPGFKLHLSYHRGWPQGMALSEALAERYEQDRSQGSTGVGPQRADVKVLANGRPARETLSTGQQKLLVAGLYLLQQKMLQRRTEQKGVLLIDDLPAELDRSARDRFCEALLQLNTQTVLTSIEGDFWHSLMCSESARMFHVKHHTVEADGAV